METWNVKLGEFGETFKMAIPSQVPVSIDIGKGVETSE